MDVSDISLEDSIDIDQQSLLTLPPISNAYEVVYSRALASQGDTQRIVQEEDGSSSIAQAICASSVEHSVIKKVSYPLSSHEYDTRYGPNLLQCSKESCNSPSHEPLQEEAREGTFQEQVCSGSSLPLPRLLQGQQHVCPIPVRVKQPLREIKHPQYANVHDRIKINERFPKEQPTAAQLAYADLVYTGKEDRVFCYICGEVIENWDPDDDPAEEHNKYYGECSRICL